MNTTRQVSHVRSISIALCLSLAVLGVTGPAASAMQAPWIPDVQKEWERYGRREFQPVAADQPHATLVFRDVADRTGSGPFDIWVLVDGQRVMNWTASSPLRVAPGAHCIRIEMVSISQRYEGNLGKYWPWLPEDFEHTAQLTREAGAYRIDYRPTRLNVKGLLDPAEMKFSADRPKDGEAAYAYCMKFVTERR